MLNPEDAAIGQTIYLRPQTKLASRACHLRLAASIVGYTRWPYVTVHVPNPPDDVPPFCDVHHLNVGLHPGSKTADKKDGDQSTAEHRAARKVKPAFRPHRPLSLNPNEQEVPLW